MNEAVRDVLLRIAQEATEGDTKDKKKGNTRCISLKNLRRIKNYIVSIQAGGEKETSTKSSLFTTKW